jgi:hypothetical protein
MLHYISEDVLHNLVFISETLSVAHMYKYVSYLQNAFILCGWDGVRRVIPSTETTNWYKGEQVTEENWECMGVPNVM